MTCEKSKQCNHEDICRFAQSTEYHILGGSCFEPKDPQTNEEWLRSATTEQLAEWLETIMRLSGTCEFIGGCFKCPLQPCGDIVDFERQIWLAWLKQPHTFE